MAGVKGDVHLFHNHLLVRGRYLLLIWWVVCKYQSIAVEGMQCSIQVSRDRIEMGSSNIIGGSNWWDRGSTLEFFFSEIQDFKVKLFKAKVLTLDKLGGPNSGTPRLRWLVKTWNGWSALFSQWRYSLRASLMANNLVPYIVITSHRGQLLGEGGTGVQSPICSVLHPPLSQRHPPQRALRGLVAGEQGEYWIGPWAPRGLPRPSESTRCKLSTDDIWHGSITQQVKHDGALARISPFNQSICGLWYCNYGWPKISPSLSAGKARDWISSPWVALTCIQSELGAWSTWPAAHTHNSKCHFVKQKRFFGSIYYGPPK